MADKRAFKATMQVKTKTPTSATGPSTSSPPVTLLKLQEKLDEYVDKIMLKVKQFTEELLEEFEQQILGRVKKTVVPLAEYVDVVAEKVQSQETKCDAVHVKYKEENADLQSQITLQKTKCDAAHEKYKEEIADLQSQITMLRFENTQFALRIRGLPESKQEDLKYKISSSLASVLDCDQGVVMEELDCVYRVNSKIAAQKNLPRDVVIYFFRRTCRNLVIQKYYQKKFQIDGFDIILLKEVPTAILQKRKDFLFLTQELRRRKVLFRWNIPVGLTVTFENKCHKLNTVQEAKDFYTLLVSSAFQREGMVELSTMFKDSLLIQDGKDFQIPEESAQMMTRAMTKQKSAKK